MIVGIIYFALNHTIILTLLVPLGILFGLIYITTTDTAFITSDYALAVIAAFTEHGRDKGLPFPKDIVDGNEYVDWQSQGMPDTTWPGGKIIFAQYKHITGNILHTMFICVPAISTDMRKVAEKYDPIYSTITHNIEDRSIPQERSLRTWHKWRSATEAEKLQEEARLFGPQIRAGYQGNKQHEGSILNR